MEIITFDFSYEMGDFLGLGWDLDWDLELGLRLSKNQIITISLLLPIVQVEEWLSEVDFDGDGVLSYEEFKMCFMANVSGM